MAEEKAAVPRAWIDRRASAAGRARVAMSPARSRQSTATSARVAQIGARPKRGIPSSGPSDTAVSIRRRTSARRPRMPASMLATWTASPGLGGISPAKYFCASLDARSSVSLLIAVSMVPEP